MPYTAGVNGIGYTSTYPPIFDSFQDAANYLIAIVHDLWDDSYENAFQLAADSQTRARLEESADRKWFAVQARLINATPETFSFTSDNLEFWILPTEEGK